MNETRAAREATSLAQLLDSLPLAVYMTNADGVLTYFNRAAADLAGREPVIGSDLWCVGHKLYAADGTPIEHSECPMAVALRERRPVRGVEIIAERPDGTRIPILPFPTPITDAAGNFAGAVNVLMDISELKQTQRSLLRRADTQTAMHRFADRVYRSTLVASAYEAALDVIAEVLNCNRASILVFDGDGVARFVAWRGLSDGYRQAVEGHCPWKPGEKNPEPIFIEDFDATDEPNDLKATIKAEHIRGVAFVPLVGAGGTIGKFMLYFDDPHAFTKEEMELSVLIARHLGFSLNRWQADNLRQAADEMRGKIAAIVESSGDAIISKDLNGRITSWNKAAERLFGYLAEEAVGKSITMLIPEGHLDEETHIIGRVRRGERVEHYETVRQRKDGSLIDLSLTVSPIKNSSGQVVGASKIARDISDRRRADEHKTLLIHELNHRVKNTLATVQSLAMQSLRDGKASGRDDFEARLIALSRAHDILTDENWQGAWLEDVVRQAVAPFGDRRVVAEGPSVRLSPKQSLAISMVLHELATNATKYGALSGDAGKVEIVWSVMNGNEPARLQLSWTETGGPAVATPKTQGFGSRMIARSLANELAGTAELEFKPEGAVCTISTPIGWGTVGLGSIVHPRTRMNSL